MPAHHGTRLPTISWEAGLPAHPDSGRDDPRAGYLPRPCPHVRRDGSRGRPAPDARDPVPARAACAPGAGPERRYVRDLRRRQLARAARLHIPSGRARGVGSGPGRKHTADRPGQTEDWLPVDVVGATRDFSLDFGQTSGMAVMEQEDPVGSSWVLVERAPRPGPAGHAPDRSVPATTWRLSPAHPRLPAQSARLRDFPTRAGTLSQLHSLIEAGQPATIVIQAPPVMARACSPTSWRSARTGAAAGSSTPPMPKNYAGRWPRPNAANTNSAVSHRGLAGRRRTRSMTRRSPRPPWTGSAPRNSLGGGGQQLRLGT